MTIDPKIVSALRTRLEQLRRWLGDEAPYATVDQHHLDEHTPERAYWHYGYMTAIRDVLEADEACPSQTRDNEGSAN